MKRIIFLIILLVTTSNLYSQSKFSVGSKTSFIRPIYGTDKNGFGFSVELNYMVFSDLELMLSTGYMVWGSNPDASYSVRVIPDVFGVKYYPLNSDFKIYITGEIHKVFGKNDIEYYSYDEEKKDYVFKEVKSSGISEFVTYLGTGIVFPIASNIYIDMSVSGMLTYISQELANVRYSIGVKYQL